MNPFFLGTFFKCEGMAILDKTTFFYRSLIQLGLFLTSFHCFGNTIDHNKHPAYLGFVAGYGSTTWDGLVPSKANQNFAMNLSTPTEVREGGATWGFYGGYELNPFFAFELSYQRYPDAQVTFDEISLFTFLNNGMTEFTTHTETINLMAKVMVTIPSTDIKLYSSAGAAEVHRSDVLFERWRLSPTFSAGFNHDFTQHIMGELGANYTAGYGEAQLNPTEVYFPFLYSIFVRIGYRI